MKNNDIIDTDKEGVLMNVLFDLFITFAKIGLFTFGGGYAMIAIIENNCVEKKQWITHDEMMDITVIAESTPGPIAINCATYTGYKTAGILGSIVATLGIVLPSFLVIYFISVFMSNFLEIKIIANAFKGIKIGIGLLILDVGIGMVKKMPKKKLPRLIMMLSFVLMTIISILSLKISTITIMLSFGFVSLIVSLCKMKQGGNI